MTTKIGSGATPKGGHEAYHSRGVPLIRSLNVHDGSFRREKLAFLDEDQAARLNSVAVQHGDVLLNITGASIARCCAVPDEVVPARVNQHVSIIRPVPERLDSAYLVYFLISAETKRALLGIGESGGTTRQALTKAQLQTFQIPLPPLAEQKRIVAILDAAFEGIDTAIANAEQNLANARALFGRVLETTFAPANNWPTCELENLLAEQPRNGWSPPAAHYGTGGQTPVLTLSAVTGFKYDGSKIKWSSAPPRAEAHYWVRPGEVLVTRSNTVELVGHVALYDGNPERVICPDLVIKFRPDPRRLISSFLYYFMRTARCRKILQEAAVGANPTMRKISKRTLQGLIVPFPDPGLQRHVVDKLDEIEQRIGALEETYERKRFALQQLKQSILAKAFAGELVASEAAMPEAAE